MRISKADTGPKMTVDITPSEKEVAKKSKKKFVKSLDLLEKAVDTILDIKEAIASERPSKDDLKNKYRGKFLRYRRKVQDKFNTFLEEIKENLELISKISDPEMIRLREVLIAEIDELSDGAEAVMRLLGEPDRDNFTKTLEQLARQMEKRKRSIKDVIDSQFFSHIDEDILGKMKLSEISNRIKKRSRLVKNMIVRNHGIY